MEQPLCGQPVVEVCSDHVGFACIFVGGDRVRCHQLTGKLPSVAVWGGVQLPLGLFLCRIAAILWSPK